MTSISSGWNNLYSGGPLLCGASDRVVQLLPRLIAAGVRDVLDLGCGSGRHTKLLAAAGFSVTATDFSSHALDQAKQTCSEYAVSYKECGFEDLPFETGSVDFVLANHVFEYATLQASERGIGELRRVLRSKGFAFVSLLSDDHPYNGKQPHEIVGGSFAAYCIRNRLPVQFFSKEQIEELFRDFRIEDMVHSEKLVQHGKINAPVHDWSFLVYAD